MREEDLASAFSSLDKSMGLWYHLPALAPGEMGAGARDGKRDGTLTTEM
jgi:hypothetical protein